MYKAFFTYFPFVLALAAFLLFVLPARMKVRAQAIWAMVFLFGAMKFVCFETFGGDAFVPDLPEKVIWFWNWVCGGIYLFVPLAFVGLFFPRRVRIFAIPLLAWGLCAKGIYNGLSAPAVVARTCASTRVSPSLDGYRIVHLSDLHISSAARRWRTQAIVDRVNALNPDLIVITGDIVDGYTKERARDAEPLRALRARDGVYYCTGNHEYYFEWSQWRELYAKWGLKLVNSKNSVRVREDLHVAGIDDPASGRTRRVELEKMFAGVTTNVFSILLQHQPSAKFQPKKLLEAPVDLQLSGHTHGGLAPGFDGLTRKWNDGFLFGFQPRVKADDSRGFVYTTTGAGSWAGFPMRFFTPSEIAVITLRHQQEQK